MPRVTDGQVRDVMETYTRTGSVKRAAIEGGVDRGTAAKYIKAVKLPSQLAEERGERAYRTRENPFESVWSAVEAMLIDAPELEGKALFEFFLERQSGEATALREVGKDDAAEAVVQFDPGQVRTFQRHVKQWRAQHGPNKEVFFTQEHKPGEAMQTDFTWATELGVTIAGELLAHMLCHSVLPYSNWQWATICQSENFLALREGFQNATIRLGKRPTFHQTDQSTTATHKVGDRAKFNDDYAALMKHYGLKPRTIGVGKKEQNGDIEAANGALKRRIKQHLLLRGSGDFESLDDYRQFLHGILDAANALRHKRLTKELKAMRALNVSRVPDYKKERMRVSRGSTIRVKNNAYSVPSQLIREWVDVRIYDGRIEVWYAQKLQLSVLRLLGDNGFDVNYRHIIWSMVRKPGAFMNYKYREAMFPTLVFREAFDAIEKHVGAGYKANLQYLRILHQAAATMECEVELALTLLLEAKQVINVDAVRELAGDREAVTVPDLAAPTVDLHTFDRLVPNMGGAL